MLLLLRIVPAQKSPHARSLTILQRGKMISPQHEGINNALAPFANTGIRSEVDAAQEAVKKMQAQIISHAELALYNAGNIRKARRRQRSSTH